MTTRHGDPLLATKLHVPQAPLQLVHRPHLVERLQLERRVLEQRTRGAPHYDARREVVQRRIPFITTQADIHRCRHWIDVLQLLAQGGHHAGIDVGGIDLAFGADQFRGTVLKS